MDSWKADVWRHRAYGADTPRFNAYRSAVQCYAQWLDPRAVDDLMLERSELHGVASSAHAQRLEVPVWTTIETDDFGIGPYYGLVSSEGARVLLPPFGIFPADAAIHHEILEDYGAHVLAPVYFAKPGVMLWANDADLERFIADLEAEGIGLDAAELARELLLQALEDELDEEEPDAEDDDPLEPDPRQVEALIGQWTREAELAFDAFLSGCRRTLEARQTLVCWDER